MAKRNRWIRLPGIMPLVLALLVGGLTAGHAEEKVGKEEALDAGLPDAAEVEKETLYLSEEERKQIEDRADAELESRLFTVYKGLDGDTVTGYAFIDTRTIRTKPATFMVVLSPEGKVRQTRVLAWKEPPEYKPGERWLAQFEGHGLEPHTRLGGEIQSMSGASLTSRTLTDGVRRALAVHAVKLAEDD
ncbi:MAG: FMN-binding protein [Thiohalorhabdus sp.]|uniref:FMN-binding protein n=1 Tax=Thiohalorhabdus sp. TaxID=3094134 RepID=UPI003980A2E5